MSLVRAQLGEPRKASLNWLAFFYVFSRFACYCYGVKVSDKRKAFKDISQQEVLDILNNNTVNDTGYGDSKYYEYGIKEQNETIQKVNDGIDKLKEVMSFYKNISAEEKHNFFDTLKGIINHIVDVIGKNFTQANTKTFRTTLLRS